MHRCGRERNGLWGKERSVRCQHEFPSRRLSGIRHGNDGEQGNCQQDGHSAERLRNLPVLAHDPNVRGRSSADAEPHNRAKAKLQGEQPDFGAKSLGNHLLQAHEVSSSECERCGHRNSFIPRVTPNPDRRHRAHQALPCAEPAALVQDAASCRRERRSHQAARKRQRSTAHTTAQMRLR